MTHQRQQLGKEGERIAAGYLRNKGYTVLATNWRCNVGEIDIIAQDQQQGEESLVFVEVRTRRNSTTEAFASITRAKREKLIRTAYAYINAHDLHEDTPWRIDVIGVALMPGTKPHIEHAEDALGW